MLYHIWKAHGNKVALCIYLPQNSLNYQTNQNVSHLVHIPQKGLNASIFYNVNITIGYYIISKIIDY